MRMIQVPDVIKIFNSTVNWSERPGRWILCLIVGIALSIIGNPCSADLIGFQSFSWDNDEEHIFRNGAPIVEPATETIPDIADGEDFFFIQSFFDVFNDISYSGAGAGNPQIYAHVYNFTNPEVPTYYTSKNTTGHSRTYNFSAAEIGHPQIRRFRFQDDLILNGSLILAYDDAEADNLEGLLASFKVQVFRETVNRRGKIKRQKLLDGIVELLGTKKGKFKIKTKGAIKNKHISQVTFEQGLITVDLIDELLTYSTRVRVNQDFSIVTLVTSNAENMGEGTGAEVIFGPGLPNIPVFHETGEVPEPATLLLLTGGALIGLRRRRKTTP